MLLVRSQDAIWTNLDGKIVVMGVESGNYFEIEGVGQDIWELLEQKRSIDEMVDAIVAGYEVDAARCESDVRAFIATLLNAKLIRDVE